MLPAAPPACGYHSHRGRRTVPESKNCTAPDWPPSCVRHWPTQQPAAYPPARSTVPSSRSIRSQPCGNRSTPSSFLHPMPSGPWYALTDDCQTWMPVRPQTHKHVMHHLLWNAVYFHPSTTSSPSSNARALSVGQGCEMALDDGLLLGACNCNSFSKQTRKVPFVIFGKHTSHPCTIRLQLEMSILFAFEVAKHFQTRGRDKHKHARPPDKDCYTLTLCSGCSKHNESAFAAARYFYARNTRSRSSHQHTHTPRREGTLVRNSRRLLYPLSMNEL